VTTIPRPKLDEHAPYYSRYIDRVPDGDLVAQLGKQLMDTTALLAGLSAERENFAYAPGKWTVKQVVLHLCDVERVMGYRALTFARNDPTDLPGFDENTWADVATGSGRALADIVEEFRAIRAATIHFARHLTPEELARRGNANGKPVSVRALLYIIAGHETHHAELFRERYLLP